MASTIGIPSTRVSDLFVRTRLLSQLRYDQIELFRIQEQISTGYRFSIPSQDAPAALRAIELQRLLERKTQVQQNLTTNQSYLGATDAALAGVSGLLSEIRATALSVADTLSTNEQREAAAITVQRASQQLLDIANQQFRGRYLFAGSRSVQSPFQAQGGMIAYAGNDRSLLSYSDIDVLFETNANGHQVFGAYSTQVQGVSDLNPVLTSATLVSDLRGGLGLSRGSVAVSDGVTTSIVDISGAITVGDIVRLLEANPPTGRELTATITATGLNISLDGGSLSIREVGGGTTVRELGILHETGGGPGPVIGGDLNPQLRLTTPLANILGVRAEAVVASAGVDNDFRVRAVARGAEYNDVTIRFVDGGAGVAGNETVVYDDSDPADKTLTITIEDGVSTAAQVVQAINGQVGALFQAAVIADDGMTGSGAVALTATADTSGGGGIEFDQDSGLRISNGGQLYEISLTSAETIEDLLNILNGSGAGVHAELNTARNGINVRSLLSGGDFSIGENGGLTATHLGIRSLTYSTYLADLSYQRGLGTVPGTDFVIRRRDGQELAIDVTGLLTIGDVLSAINDHPANQDPATGVVARLIDVGNGIELVDDNLAGTETLEVRRVNSSLAAERLGLIAPGATEGAAGTAPVAAIATVTLPGADNDFTITSLQQGASVNGLRVLFADPGLRAFAEVPSAGANNDLRFEVLQPGAAFNGIQISFVDGGPPAAGNETVDYDPLAGTLVFTIADGTTDANRIIDVLANDPLAGSVFAATLDTTVDDPNDGTGPVAVTATGTFGNGADESAVYDEVAGTLLINVDVATADANRVLGLINDDPQLGTLFEAALIAADGSPNQGTGAVDLTATATFVGGGAETLTGVDTNPLEVQGVFNALIRLRDALNSHDVLQIERAIDLIDKAMLKVNFARAEIGARQQGLDVLKGRLDAEDIELRSALSDEIDADLVEVISNFTARQAAFQASMQVAAQILQLSLLNFL